MKSCFVKEKVFYKELWSLSIVMIGQCFLTIFVDTVNSLLLGGISQVGMTAMSQANQVNWIIKTIIGGFTIGTQTLIAQYYGSNKREQMHVLVSVSLRIMLIFTAIVTVIVLCFSQKIMRLYSNDSEIIELGSRYLKAVASTYILEGFTYSLYSSHRGTGEAKFVLVNNLINTPINVFFSYALIFGKFGFPELGIIGAAVSALITRILKLLILFIYMWKFEKKLKYSFRAFFKRDPLLTKDYVKLTAPIVGHEILWAVGTSAGSMIAGQLGKSAVAGYDIMATAYNLIYSLFEGFYYSCAIIIGISIGRGDNERVKAQARTMMALGLGLGILVGGITLLGKNAFLGMYILDDMAVYYSNAFFIILAVLSPIMALQMTGMLGILRGGGDPKTSLYTNLIAIWLVTLPLALLAAFKWNADPVIIVIILKTTLLIGAVIGTVKVFRMKWIRNLTR